MKPPTPIQSALIHPALRVAALALLSLVPTGCGAAPDVMDRAMPAPAVDGEPRRLSQMGLYRNLAAGEIADGFVEYQPAYPLWSDGAEKRRWIRLPPGATIDTTDFDHWVLPVGTQAFKEFSVGGRRIETRYIARTPSGDDFATFVWLADGSDAVETTGGVHDALGSGHDVPAATACMLCHQGEPGHVLGFSAMQLADARLGPTVSTLAQDGLLSRPPVGDVLPPPGDATTSAALGYLHGNCGHCHSPTGYASFTGQFLRLSVGDRTPAATATYRTTVNVPLEIFSAPGITYRVAPGDPDHSAITYRMNHRGDAAQMPPLATQSVDPDGLAAVGDWIRSLP